MCTETGNGNKYPRFKKRTTKAPKRCREKDLICVSAPRRTSSLTAIRLFLLLLKMFEMKQERPAGLQVLRQTVDGADVGSGIKCKFFISFISPVKTKKIRRDSSFSPFPLHRKQNPSDSRLSNGRTEFEDRHLLVFSWFADQQTHQLQTIFKVVSFSPQ